GPSISDSTKAVFPFSIMRSKKLCGISTRFRMLSPSYGQVTHVLLTRSPLFSRSEASFQKKEPFDLHVLGTPPAFVLSQDQTLM
ncbi:Hypothetical protein Tpal_2811, partial [Trichococcus palustris]